MKLTIREVAKGLAGKVPTTFTLITDDEGGYSYIHLALPDGYMVFRSVASTTINKEIHNFLCDRLEQGAKGNGENPWQ